MQGPLAALHRPQMLLHTSSCASISCLRSATPFSRPSVVPCEPACTSSAVLERSRTAVEAQPVAHSSRSRTLRCRASTERHPFKEEDYVRVEVQVHAAHLGQHSSGNLVMYAHGTKATKPETPVLILQVSGDALLAISNLLTRRHHDRPLALDVLSTVLARGQEISKSDWKLACVAVTELRGMIFIGRLFFGRDTGEMVWDTDCRPSDGTWLALKEKAPIYVHKSVWDSHTVPMNTLNQHSSSASASAGTDSLDQLTGLDALTTTRDEDPESLKLLKRKLGVAIAEEDYALAANIRDHPYMVLHLKAVQHRQAGQKAEAQEIYQQLRQLIHQREEDSGSFTSDHGTSESQT
ncbi:hypothetical protein WJX73_002576 [Symbiochloris irregularis]|uniref:BFN domain-containing protein n=1 Tax=Symbiochloris irregularis TaxID=706552 RepID=A0AAW1NS04_9CHLO